ncbi:transporter substrate-binding domain-containing protein [Clostridium estertheticum]|uniref:transporter substrate-binding domain-containing protein n=1 Tax=Clostridium estertheticum TaxID=238834 RepID=UPI0013E9786C|nr:transporter substrate-binding domain-containing protein [Clostridium estertheticum]MBZ9686976.1 transporter substrate-binding domain-containing protein [Clostridium estertheticum]
MKKKYILGFLIIITALIFANSYFKIEHNMNIVEFFSKDQRLNASDKEYLKEYGDLIYGSDQNTPPLRYLNSDSGQYEGLVIDYFNALSIELGVKIKMKPMVWNDALTALERGDIDFCDMHASKDRSRSFIFTDPIYYQRGAILIKKNNTNIKTPGDIKGKTIAAIKGDYIFEHLAENYTDVHGVETKNLRDAISRLEKSDVDAVLGDESVINYYLTQEGLSREYSILNEYLYERPALIGVKKGNERLVTILNKAIYQLQKDNTMERIYGKWFGISPLIMKNNNAEIYMLYVKYAIVLAMIFALFFYYWNRELKIEVKKQTNALSISKNELETTFNGLTTHLMVVVNEDCFVAESNTAFCEYIGSSVDVVKHMHCKNINGILGSNCDVCLIKDIFETRTSVEKAVEYQNRTFKVRTYLLDKVPNTRERVLIMMEDITDLKFAQQKMLQSSKMAAVGQLAAGIAHEIRTPLGIIRNYTYLLRRMEKEEDKKEAIDTIETSVTRANKIIDNLLNFSRLSDNKIHNIEVKDFIANLYELNQKALKQKHIDFKLYVERDLEVELYSESLKHILLNLFSNATNAMQQGGILQVQAFKSYENIIIEVSDTGIGMDANTQMYLFDPFYTTKQVSGGTGLGLFIVYNEVQKMEGTIRVESKIGEGSKFIITLPTKINDPILILK